MNFLRKWYSVAVFSVLAWAFAAHAETYYVAPAGSDSNTGSSASPFLTIQKAADILQPGDAVIVRAGNYSGFSVPQSGSATARISYLAEPGATITVPGSSGGVEAGIIGSGRSYITVSGFTFQPQAGQQQWDAAIRFNSGATAGVHQFGNEYLSNTAERRIGAAAGDSYYHTLYASWQDGILVRGNVVKDAYNSGIYIANSSRNYTVRGNKVSGSGGNGIHNNGDGSAGGLGINKNAVIEDNVIYNVNFDTGGQAISCDGVQDSVIRNNLLYDIKSKGISLYVANAAGGSSGNTVVNNTVVMASGAYTPLRINHDSPNNTVFNNIFIAPASNGCWTDSEESGLEGSSLDYNVTFGNPCVGGSKRNDWGATYGFDTHSLASTAAEIFNNVTASDFSLKAGSTAIDRGTSSNAPVTDILGGARPAGAAHDVGAYEFGSAPPSGSTPTPTPVVPPGATATPGSGVLRLLSFKSSAIKGGRSVMATITLNTGAPEAGAVVKLKSSSAVAKMRRSMKILSGNVTGRVAIRTSRVLRKKRVTISASYGEEKLTAVLTVKR